MSKSVPVPVPVPPPPPPANILNTCSTFVEKDNVIVSPTLYPNNECSWAMDYPEVQKGCFLSRVSLHEQPKRCRYYNISSILQIGPTCGLTALSMLLNGQPNVNELLMDATKQNYTINGEMFSAQYLYKLTQNHVKSQFVCEYHEGCLDCPKIKEQLIAGACLLVPYPFQTKFQGIGLN